MLALSQVSAMTRVISRSARPYNLAIAAGHCLMEAGIVTGKLNAALIARFTGDIPQNINFALKAEVVRTFLDSKGIVYHSAPSDKQLLPADVGDIARPFTLRIECEGTSTQVAMPAAPNPPTSSANKKTEPVPRWGMQVTANYSESKACATYRLIQKQYAALIGDREPIVIRSRGIGLGNDIRYNIRIADDDRAYLEKLCRKLITAGGACVVLRNDKE
jgi:hypothetical protein